MDRLRAVFPKQEELELVSRLAATLADTERSPDADRFERLVCAVARESRGSVEAFAHTIEEVHAGLRRPEDLLLATGFGEPLAHRGWVPAGMEIIRHAGPGMPGRSGAFFTAVLGLGFLAIPITVLAGRGSTQPTATDLLVAIPLVVLPLIIAGTCAAGLLVRWRNGIPGPTTIRLDGHGWSAGPASGDWEAVKTVGVGPLDAWRSTWFVSITRQRTATEAGRRTVVLPLTFDHASSSADAVLVTKELVTLMRRAGVRVPVVQVMVGSRFRNVHEEPSESKPDAEGRETAASGRGVEAV